MGQKNYAKLVKKVITDKKGKKKTVWVKRDSGEGEKKKNVSTEAHAIAVHANAKSRSPEILGAISKINTRIKNIDNQEGSRSRTDEKDRLVALKKKLEQAHSTPIRDRVKGSVTKSKSSDHKHVLITGQVSE